MKVELFPFFHAVKSRSLFELSEHNSPSVHTGQRKEVEISSERQWVTTLFIPPVTRHFLIWSQLPITLSCTGHTSDFWGNWSLWVGLRMLILWMLQACTLSVPHKEGLETIHYHLYRGNNRWHLGRYLWHWNSSVKNDFRFVQRQGVAFSPNYANLFMGKFEEDHVRSDNPSFSLVQCWYIDDLFVLYSLVHLRSQKLLGGIWTLACLP